MALTVRIRGDASQFDKTMRGVKSTIGGLSSKIAGIGAAALGAAGAYMTLSTAFDAVKSASEKAAGMEDLTLQLELLTGSAEKAKSMIKLFRDEAAKSSLSSEDYAQAAKTMMAFGMAADDTVPIMKSLADISMGNGERFGSLALAFAQTSAAGRLMGQEVLQFVSAGFNPLQQISLKTGESMATLKKRMEDGAISAAEVTQAFIDATSAGGKFYGAIQKGADSTSAKIAQTKDNIDKIQIAFGTGFNEGLKDALDAANGQLPQLEERFAAAGDFIGQAITESLSGNVDKFAMIGQLLGDAIFAGIQSTLITGMDNLGEKLGDLLAYGAENLSVASVAAPDMAKGVGSFIRDNTRSATNFGEQLTNARESSGLNASIDAIKTQMAIEKGIKTGIDSSMSQAVREGVLEAWARQPQNAKFSN